MSPCENICGPKLLKTSQFLWVFSVLWVYGWYTQPNLLLQRTSKKDFCAGCDKKKTVPLGKTVDTQVDIGLHNSTLDSTFGTNRLRLESCAFSCGNRGSFLSGRGRCWTGLSRSMSGSDPWTSGRAPSRSGMFRPSPVRRRSTPRAAETRTRWR